MNVRHLSKSLHIGSFLALGLTAAACWQSAESADAASTDSQALAAVESADEGTVAQVEKDAEVIEASDAGKEGGKKNCDAEKKAYDQTLDALNAATRALNAAIKTLNEAIDALNACRAVKGANCDAENAAYKAANDAYNAAAAARSAAVSAFNAAVDALNACLRAL